MDLVKHRSLRAVIFVFAPRQPLRLQLVAAGAQPAKPLRMPAGSSLN
jgi:hypothetical protein